MGVYGTYAVSVPNSSQSASSGRGVEVGAKVAYHFAPRDTTDPWLGLGVGLEWATITASSGDVTLLGFQLPVVALGLDFRSRDSGFAIGPLVVLSAGEYFNVSASSGSAMVFADVQNQAWHAWLTLGLRGAYDFPVKVVATPPPGKPSDANDPASDPQ